MLKKALKFLRNVSIGVGVVLLAVWFYLAQPTLSANDTTEASIDIDRMQNVVKTLSVNFHPRSYGHTDNLNLTAAFIEDHFADAGGRIEKQEFSISGTTYYNIRCMFGPSDGPRQIIGAHYDSHGKTPGADDNASGVAGLIELAYILGKQAPETTIELVAYTLEEPPFFATKDMGSYHHAKAVTEEGHPITGVIVLEMIGYYDDAFGSQEYPTLLFKLLYPNTGDFIAVIGKLDQRPFIADIKAGMNGAAEIDVYSIAAPTQVPGIDFSDHRNYWEFGYDAVMISDTAFYRNKEYHKAGDTWDRLDYKKMGEVVKAVLGTLNVGTSNVQH
ncbi:MAG: M28 family peptidase [Opitutaceae bacterium]